MVYKETSERKAGGLMIGEVIRVYLSNGRQAKAVVRRCNKSTVWVELPDGNTIKRNLKRITEPYRSKLEHYLDERPRSLLYS
jgi:hypothetical protein